MPNLRPFELPIDSSGVYSNMTNDFTAAYQATGTVRCSGLSFTPDASQIVKVVRLVFSTPNYIPVIMPLEVGFSISTGTGYFDIVFNGITSFASTDKYQVFVSGAKKNFDLGADASLTKIINSNPSIPTTTLVDTTNVAATTTYYPSSLGIQITRKAKLRIWDYCTGGGSGGVTNRIEIARDAAFTTPIGVMGQDCSTADAKVDWVDSGAATDGGKVIDYEGIDQCFFRIKSITGDATNTVKIAYDITFETLI